MATVILVANAVVTVLLAWMTLNHFQLVEYDPMDIAVNQFQRLVFYSQLDGSVRAPPETFMTVPEIIQSRGYPVEIHHVTTEDGYILELHRIPGSVNEPVNTESTHKKKPVFLQHGIFATDFVWAVGPSNGSLAYILADHGYDVWMGNSRGNTYSRKHKTLDPDSEKYWDFTWEELGQYDLPNSIDYVLKVTGQQKVSYVGYSLGCAIFYVGANLRPELNDKIEVMIGLAPTSTVQVLDNAFKLVAPLSNPLKYVMQWTKTGLFLPSDGLSSRFLRFVCNSSQIGSATCQTINFYVFGYSETTDLSLVHVLVGHYPAGGSPKTMLQFFDNYNSGGNFTRFDYGESGNLERYGTAEAPKYQMELVTAPVYLLWSKTDPVSTPRDIEWLAMRLGNLKGSVEVNAPVFSHGDFFMSTQASKLVYEPLLKMLPPP
ncbi:lipase lipl-1-like [Daphnia pulicaria]|uniref:lipase lipl-1-like n=1 Tax=Daphnia pulicaria TaxID=35523 RepID=UPI001EEABD3A|nr:lipase lipl-1-like [Daphnia pulicaria]